jgi:hypothetical protein
LTVDHETQRAWALGWQKAGKALEQVRQDELRGLSPERALAAIDNLLSLGARTPVSPARRRSSGLAEQQRLFARLRS